MNWSPQKLLCIHTTIQSCSDLYTSIVEEGHQMLVSKSDLFMHKTPKCAISSTPTKKKRYTRYYICQRKLCNEWRKVVLQNHMHILVMPAKESQLRICQKVKPKYRPSGRKIIVTNSPFTKHVSDVQPSSIIV